MRIVHMKKPILAISFLFILLSQSTIADAQGLSRDELIDKVESIYLRSTMLSPDSPLLEMFLSQAKKANPEANADTWLAVKQDLAPALTKVLTEKGSSLDILIRKSLENLSDGELDRLVQIISDPTFIKFQSAMSSPSSQKGIMLEMYANAQKFGAATNNVLNSHGLKLH